MGARLGRCRPTLERRRPTSALPRPDSELFRPRIEAESTAAWPTATFSLWRAVQAPRTSQPRKVRRRRQRISRHHPWLERPLRHETPSKVARNFSPLTFRDASAPRAERRWWRPTLPANQLQWLTFGGRLPRTTLGAEQGSTRLFAKLRLWAKLSLPPTLDEKWTCRYDAIRGRPMFLSRSLKGHVGSELERGEENEGGRL